MIECRGGNEREKMKKSMKRFAEELKKDAKNNGWDKAALVAEINATCDVTEWFALTAAERRTYRNDDGTFGNALADRLADEILAG